MSRENFAISSAVNAIMRKKLLVTFLDDYLLDTAYVSDYAVPEYRDFPPLWRRYMTVCVAAFAERGKAVVMVSDKAVTYGTLQYDTDTTKFLRIGDTFWYALIAGDPTFAINVVDIAKRLIEREPSLSSDSIGMMNCLKRAYRIQRARLIDDLVLGPRLLSKKLLLERGVNLLPLDQKITAEVINEANNFKTDASLLVCGFDNCDPPQPHIFTVANPGKIADHDLTGFFAIGVGARTALSRLLTHEAQKKDSLPEALYQTFDAKANAEINQGVGINWDAQILVAGKKAIPLALAYRNMIDNVWIAFPDSPYWKRQLKYPVNWKERLKTHCDRIMGRKPRTNYHKRKDRR